MSTRVHHMSIDIRGVLRWKPRMMLSLFKADDGSKLTPDEVREFLYDKLAEGHRVLSLTDPPCEGWDKVNGCPGHEKNSAA